MVYAPLEEQPKQGLMREEMTEVRKVYTHTLCKEICLLITFLCGIALVTHFGCWQKESV